MTLLVDDTMASRTGNATSIVGMPSFSDHPTTASTISFLSEAYRILGLSFAHQPLYLLDARS